MIRFKLAVCAESAVRDAETNSISVFNIIEEYHSDSFPIVIPQLSCVFMLERDEGDRDSLEGSLVFSIDGEELKRSPVPIDFQGKKITRLIAQVGGAMIPRPGTFKARLSLENEVEKTWSINVKKIETEVEVDQD